MAPRNAKGSSAKQKPKEEQREDTLQAVVLADSYERRFTPFTLERPRCLLPLANTPLIEYTLEFLANAGVEDIFIYCGAHTEQVEQYINSSKWKLSTSPFHTLTLLRSTATSVGDAMRDLDKRDLVTGDFLLVSGDVVSNLAIEPALAKHRARREKDKNAIMTMILREAGTEHRTKSRGRRPVFVIDPKKERCLHYEEMTRRPAGGRYINIDPELLSTHGEIEIREDLIDCYVDICTPDVLGLWSDNFDYQSVRKSFLFGVLKDYELNGKTIHTYIVRDQYAARVRSLRAYDAVSKDIINRWTYPLCPDSNLFRDQTYRLAKGKAYFEEGVVLARGSMVKKRSVVGRDTSIGEGSNVGDSVLGRQCHIGNNVTIEGSYIWDNAVIGDGSVIKQAVIANEAVIGRNCIIEPGALISYRVCIADNITVSGNSRLTTATPLNRDTRTQTDTSIVGKGGEGYAYASDSDSDSDNSTASSRLIYIHNSATSSASSISTLHSDDDSGPVYARDTSRRESFVSDHSDESTAQNRDFHLEATASILDGLSKDDSPDVIHLELLSQRLSANANDHMMRSALVSAFMKRISNMIEGGTGANEAVKAVFGKYGDLLAKMGIADKGKESKVDQVDFLGLVEKECKGRGKGETLLLFVAKECYVLDVVEAEGVEQWWVAGEGQDEGVRRLVKDFVEWLRNAESESDEESEEDDEEDD
ncbi:hypothetical protein MMC18_008487 [Xylographa bjoerkii]|nr:hypothetical protein [Xylographa bjoerkii]MCJ1395335.1 hypothetical protein [Xylographa bjoerkii]MCJ1395601.1 hypothetical protein [Xylographa bjoerkii]